MTVSKMSSRFAPIKTFIYALFTLVGTIIGAGIFALPYITSKVGILMMLFYFLVLGLAVIILHILFAKVAVKTKGLHRLPGYAKIYLGKWGQGIAFLSSMLGLYGALLAYLIIGGGFISALPLPFFSENEIASVLLFFSLGAGLIYFGIKSIAKVELFAFFVFLAVLAFLAAEGRPFWLAKNLLNFEEGTSLFLPYGAVLFSLWGAALVPEITEMLKGRWGQVKKAIGGAVFLVILVYLTFIILVTGISGELTSKDAISGLKYFFPDWLLAFVFSFGIFACFTSFITLGLTLKKVFWYDFKIKKDFAWLLTCFLPLLIYFLGVQDFIKVISIVGIVMLGVNAILIILMYLKARSLGEAKI